MKIPVQASRPFRVRSFNPVLRTRKTAFVVFRTVMRQNFDLCQLEYVSCFGKTIHRNWKSDSVTRRKPGFGAVRIRDRLSLMKRSGEKVNRGKVRVKINIQDCFNNLNFTIFAVPSSVTLQTDHYVFI